MHFSLVVSGETRPSEQPDTWVPWWSFGKTVLAAASLSLVRDGLVGLDEQMLEGPFTLRQLLCHEAGLADYGELADYHAAVADHAQPWPAEEMLQRLDAARLRYAPGVGWGYSNVGYLYVARLIERLTGLALEQALLQRGLVPLGLVHVRLARTRADLQNVLGVAPGYDPDWVYHGLLVGPLGEAALCLDRLLGGDLLPDWLLREMQSARVLGEPMVGRPWTAPGYALGLMQGPVAGGQILGGHTGAEPGSVVAVYRCARGNHTASCAVFAEGTDEGGVEAQALRRLAAVLGSADPRTG